MGAEEKWFKKGLVGLSVGLISSIPIILDLVFGIHSKLNQVLGILLPPECVLIALMMIVAFVATFEQLLRRKPPDSRHGLLVLPGEPLVAVNGKKYCWEKKTLGRRLLWIGVAFIAIGGILTEIGAWNRYYRLPGESAEIRIIVDEFAGKGPEGVDVRQRICTALQRELKGIQVDARVAFLEAPIGIESAEDKRDWACRSGATLVIYGRKDAFAVWPEVAICAENVPKVHVETYETVVSAEDIPHEIGVANASLLPTAQRVSLCLIDSTALRVNYLAVFSLGMVMLHTDISGLTAEEELETAYELFSEAVRLGSDNQGCSLDFCEAMFRQGVTAILRSNGDLAKDRKLHLLDTARVVLSKVIDLKPEHWEANVYLAHSLCGQARILEGQQSDAYFLQSFERYAKAASLDPSEAAVVHNWGCALREYANRLEVEQAEPYYLQSFERLAEAASLDPSEAVIVSHWGYALREYANRLEVEQAEPYYLQSFERLAEAASLNPSDAVVVGTWGSALREYANRLEVEQAEPYYLQSFEKYAEAASLDPSEAAIVRDWGYALREYANRLEVEQAEPYYLQSFERHAEAASLNPSDAVVVGNWGCALREYANRLEVEQAEPYYLQSFEKHAEAASLDPSEAVIVNNWGCALKEYANRLEVEQAEPYYVQSFERYAEAASLDPSEAAVVNNWGFALREYASRLEVEQAEPYYVQSFEKYAEAASLDPSEAASVSNWGFALREYANRLEVEQAEPYYLQSFEKFAEAASLDPSEAVIVSHWGSALREYANRLEVEPAEPYYLQSFEKYAAAASLDPSEAVILRCWGTALSEYAHRLNDDDSGENLSMEELIGNAFNDEMDLADCYSELLAILTRISERDIRLAVYVTLLNDNKAELRKD